jgi:hypothetical protein
VGDFDIGQAGGKIKFRSFVLFIRIAGLEYKPDQTIYQNNDNRHNRRISPAYFSGQWNNEHDKENA